MLTETIRIEDLDNYQPEGPDRHWHRRSTFEDVLEYLDDVAGDNPDVPRHQWQAPSDGLRSTEVVEALNASGLFFRHNLTVDDGTTAERAEDLGRCVAELIDEFRLIQKRLAAITADDECPDSVVSLCDAVHDAAEQFEYAAELLADGK